MALELRNLDMIAGLLSKYLSGAWDRPVEAVELVETSVGARRGNILFVADDPANDDGPTRHDMVVTIYPPAGAVVFGIEAETGALARAAEAGAPVAHVYEVCTDPSWFGEPFFISQRIFGESLPRDILRMVAADDTLGETMARQLGRGFAAIHSVPAERAPEIIRRPMDVAPSARSLELLTEQIDELLQPVPAFELGLRWLARNQPTPPSRHTLIHGDVRTGNIMVGADGLRAILDWETCHTGDPHEDLGWVAMRTWRFGNDALEIGGFGSLQPLVEAYDEAGGHFDPDSYHWWKVFATLRWGVGLSRQTVQHLNGTYRNIAMAVSGRRAVELEYDLLRLLRPVL
jgi:aminoglycoside phosphotransferase (APT) family kinase protein